MKLFAFLCLAFLSSCYGFRKPPTDGPDYQLKKVWGNKPVYSTEDQAKKIIYLNQPQRVHTPGNIYVKGNYIYQLEVGVGIHVIDNTVSANAQRIGFLTMNGASQISMKGNYLYTNSYDDLVVVDVSNVNDLKETKRIKGAFPEGARQYYFIQPPDRGYYVCPRYDSIVIGWVKDSINSYCYRN